MHPNHYHAVACVKLCLHLLILVKITYICVLCWSQPGFRSNLQDLKDTTDKVHYETFRRNRLQSSGYVGESNI